MSKRVKPIDHYATIPVTALDRPVAFHPVFRKITGSVGAAVLLSQFWYWTNGRIPEDRDGWFYKTAKEIEDETGMSRSEQESARKRLVATGIMEEERRGVPAKMWFRLDIGVLAKLITEAEALQTSLPESSKLDCGDAANKSAGSPQTITETTHETTTETTKISRQSPSNKTPNTQHEDAKQFVGAFYGALDVPLPSGQWGPYLRAAKIIMGYGCTIDEVPQYVAFMNRLEWRKGPVTLQFASSAAVWEQYQISRHAKPERKPQRPVL